MRSAYERGYMVYTLTDCVAAVKQPATEGSIEHNYPLFSRPVRSLELKFDAHCADAVNAISFVRAHDSLLELGARAAQVRLLTTYYLLLLLTSYYLLLTTYC